MSADLVVTFSEEPRRYRYVMADGFTVDSIAVEDWPGRNYCSAIAKDHGGKIVASIILEDHDKPTVASEVEQVATPLGAPRRRRAAT